jgi:hypothetical protein
MEVHFAPDTEAQLRQFAAREGKDIAQVVDETVARMLERQAQFIEAFPGLGRPGNGGAPANLFRDPMSS